jgi:uncharacterized protein YbcV (DUF1398 family)
MINYADIQVAYQNATNYPDLVSKLIAIGIQSYTVDVVTGTVLYRLADGENILHFNNGERNIAANFSEEKTVQAIRNNQQGKSDFPTFMNEIAIAGIRFYEATLNGNNKRVTYVGSNGSYQEMIPQQ